jgi:hypothetical protein
VTAPIPTNDTTDVTWRDLILLTLMGMIYLVVVMLPHIHEGKQSEAQAKSPGDIMVELVWPADNQSDVDLWVQAPGDAPVGYSNKGGAVFNLLRDDLGRFGDLTSMNYESSYSRGIVPGEYTANVHMYRNLGSLPLEAKVVVSVTRGGQPSRQLLATTVTLTREGQERTALRWRLTEDGSLVPGSVTTAFRELRSGSK